MTVTARSLPKPAYGQPCNGCGVCCIAQQCPISTALFGEQERCPALEPAGHGFGCGVITNTAAYVPDLPAWGGQALSDAFAVMLGAGDGCDGQTEDEYVGLLARWRLRNRARERLRRASPEVRRLVQYFTTPERADA